LTSAVYEAASSLGKLRYGSHEKEVPLALIKIVRLSHFANDASQYRTVAGLQPFTDVRERLIYGWFYFGIAIVIQAAITNGIRQEK
jgi:hypothetical protein